MVPQDAVSDVDVRIQLACNDSADGVSTRIEDEDPASVRGHIDEVAVGVVHQMHWVTIKLNGPEHSFQLGHIGLCRHRIGVTVGFEAIPMRVHPDRWSIPSTRHQ